ncbi:hypothetical protein [Chryseobacterium terrae]|uniref:Uncharacterized protein n=1 Tax=Chryseobacterium terrae TaxID=3163299 RepID=A0ABW8Y504_9FLAO
MKNNIVLKFREETEKLKVVAGKQLEENIISEKEYRKIMFTLMEKLEMKKSDIEKIHIPEIRIIDYKSLDLFSLTNVLFCTG